MSNNKRGIIPWFASNPVAANLLMLLIIVLGVMNLGSIRKEAFPSISPNSLSISVAYNSGSAKQSEEGLAIKIEDQLEDVSGIKSITSTSTVNGASITIEKQTDYDLDLLLRDVKSKIDAISSFPAEAEKPVIKKAERREHALWVQLYGDADRQTLQQLAFDLKADLLSHSDVNRVFISGWLDPMMVIEVDESQLQAYELSLSDVETAIKQGSSSTRTPVIRTEDLYLQLKTSEQAYLKEEFAAIPLLTFRNGNQILLGDVTSIRDTFTDDTSALSRYNGQESIALEVVTTGQDDISDTVAGARQVVDKWLGNGNLPQSVELDTWYDRSTMITERLELLAENALLGIAIVFALLALFLNLAVALWVALGLPFIFFGAIYFMGDSFLGAGLSLNEFTTFGFIMALGIVVDDAIVIGESIYTHRSTKGDTLENTIKGTMQVALPTLFGVLTTVVAFFAISQISGGLGELYAQFATVCAICLILSVVESKLILPAHLAHINTRPYRSKNFLLRGWQMVQLGVDKGLQWVNEHCYRPLIEKALHYRYGVLVLLIIVFFLVASMPLTGVVRLSFFPTVPGDTVRAELTMKNDVSYGQTHTVLNILENKAYAADSQLGRAINGETGIASLQILSEADQSGTVKVELKKDARYDIDTFTKRWRKLAGFPEGAHTLSIQNSPRMVDALRIELRANSDEILFAAGNQLKDSLQKIPAISGIDDNLTPGQPQLHLKLTQQGRASGISMDMLAKQVLQAFSGQVVQRFQRNSDEIEVKVRYPDTSRQNVADILSANIRTDDGTVLPLSAVAVANYGYTKDTIARIDGKRAVYLSADVDKDILSTDELLRQLRQQVIPELTKQYAGLDIHFSGETEQQAETQASMLQMFLLALLIIYFLLALPLKSYTQPLVIMMAIPFGIVGALIGHWVHDLSVGILSLNGIIALAGVVVNDSLLLVTTSNEVKSHGVNLHDSTVQACRSRLRAVLLTSLTTVAGLLPLLSETSFQAQFLIPAAVSLAYGIMFGTIITLMLTPVLLMIHEDIASLFRRILQKVNPFSESPQSC